jgi:exodeoxyribonuclease-5
METQIAETSIVLTKQQQEAESLIEHGQATYRLIEGYAGTGKTTVITNFCERVKNPSKYILTAPTNKAVKVLREKLKKGLGIKTSTIHSFLGLKIQFRKDKQVLVQDGKGKTPYLDQRGMTIIIDECSMIDETLMLFIEDAVKQCDHKVVFIGDPKQLPPINEKYSRSFDTKEKVSLTQIVRQAEGNPIIQLSVELRRMIDDEKYIKPKFDESDGRITTIKDGSTNEIAHMAQLFKSKAYLANNDHVRYLAWTNKAVDSYNKMIRSFILEQQVFEMDEYYAGERIVCTAPIMYNNDIYAMTDQEFNILEATQAEWAGIPVWRLRLDSHRKTVAQVVRGSHAAEWREEKNRLVASARKKQIQWREYYSWFESFHNVKHCHALTIHRSQGSTFHTAMVNVSNIMQNRRRTEALRCLYVACTRPSDALVLVMP